MDDLILGLVVVVSLATIVFSAVAIIRDRSRWERERARRRAAEEARWQAETDRALRHTHDDSIMQALLRHQKDERERQKRIEQEAIDSILRDMGRPGTDDLPPGTNEGESQ